MWEEGKRRGLAFLPLVFFLFPSSRRCGNLWRSCLDHTNYQEFLSRAVLDAEARARIELQVEPPAKPAPARARGCRLRCLKEFKGEGGGGGGAVSCTSSVLHSGCDWREERATGRTGRERALTCWRPSDQRLLRATYCRSFLSNSPPSGPWTLYCAETRLATPTWATADLCGLRPPAAFLSTRSCGASLDAVHHQQQL